MNDQKPLKEHSFFDAGGFKPVSVGQRLRELRKEKGYSIKALAGKSGLAVNTLSLIENEKSSPSVSTLEQLAKTLEIPLTHFFEPVGEKLSLIRTQAGQRREMLLDGIRVEECGLDLLGQPMQPFIVTMPVGQGSGSAPIQHAGYEFVYALSGEVDYTVDGKSYKIKQGDSIIFNSKLPHQWQNCGEVPAKYLLILVPAETEETPGKRHFPK